MYSLTISPSVAKTIAEQQTRYAVEQSRLARAARLAREGRGDFGEPTRRPLPRRRSRLVWILGLRRRPVL